MKNELSNKKLITIVVVAFVVIFPSIFLINWFEKEVTNPRIWQSWTCEEMKQFALEGSLEELNDFQQVKFDEDLLECMSQ